MEKLGVGITGSTSILVENFIKYSQDYYSCYTVGRRNSDIYWDLAAGDTLVFPDGIDVVIHAAAVMECECDNELLNMLETNIMGSIRLCISAYNSSVKKIIYISSINSLLQPDNKYFSYYSITKQQAEVLIKQYCRSKGISLCIIRPSQIFGIDERYKKNQPLLYMMLQKARNGENIEFYGNHDALRNYIYDKNIFEILRYVIDNKVNDEINAISPRNYRLKEAAEIIIREYNSKSQIIFNDKEKDIEDNAFNFSEDYFSMYGIKFMDFEAGVKDIIESHI